MKACSKPGCSSAGAALLGYDYSTRRAVLQDPPDTGEVSPHLYILCSPCAERLRPPQGWMLDDLRTEPPLFVARDGPVGGEVDGAGDEDSDEMVSVRRQLFFGYSA